MGKASKWLKSLFLTGKKSQDKNNPKEQLSSSHSSSVVPDQQAATPVQVLPTTPKEKRRWSFRRSSATAAAPKDSHSAEPDLEGEDARIQIMIPAENSEIEEAAAIKIQSAFRAYLARKALSALRGLVKLQALVRGHLVRKQATATLRCMQALVTAQARALAQRVRMADHESNHKSRKLRHPYTYNEVDDRGVEENIKIVDMDYSKEIRNRNSCQVSPVPSAITDMMTPRTYSGHFDDCRAQSSPQCNSAAASKPDDPSSRPPFSFLRPDDQYADPSVSYEYPLYPSYMANTESSRAKVRSQSAPKSRPDSFERQPSRRRASMEGRNVPRGVMRMQRSSSNAGYNQHQHAWLIKLDRSTVSLVDSECGSTSTMLTETNYGARSLVSCDPYGSRYESAACARMLNQKLASITQL